MDEDEVIKSCTRLLEKGCTMLATHHDCGAPLFRCQGEVVCPVCSFQTQKPAAEGVVQPLGRAEAKGESGGELRSEPRKEGVGTGPGTQDEWAQAEENLREIMLRKLKELAGDLSEEQDLSKMKSQLDCIEGLHKILQSLSR